MVSKILKKIKNKKLISLLFLFVLFFPVYVHAQYDWFTKGIWSIINGAIYDITNIIANLVVYMVGFLTRIAAYNHFVDLQVIIDGWTVVRDVCNMFFIVILMVVAVSTILRLEAYNYKKILPKLLVMSVLINFSLLFTGWLIDASQAVTLTFADALKGVGEGNLLKGLGIDKMYQLTKNKEGVGTKSFITLLMIMAMMGLALLIVTSFVFIFLARIAAFWILAVLSPFAYFFSAAGGGFTKYADEWWSEFTKYLIVGPVLAFFLWLSFYILGASAGNMAKSLEFDTTGLSSIGDSIASEADNFAGFLVAIAILWGSLAAANKIGVAGASAASGFVKKGGKFGKDMLWKGGQAIGRGMGKAGGAGAAAGAAAGSFVPVVGTVAGGIIGGIAGKYAEKKARTKYPSSLLGKWAQDSLVKEKNRKRANRLKTLETLGMSDETMDVLREKLDDTKFKKGTRLAGAGAGAAVGAAAGSVVPIIGTAAGAVAGGIMGSIGGFMATSDVTKRAAKKGSQESLNARNSVHSANVDTTFMPDASGSTFYASGGQTDQQKKFFDQLTSADNSDSAGALTKINEWINSVGFNNDPNGRDVSILRGLAKGIAAYDKGDNDTSRLNIIKTSIERRAASVGNRDKLDKVDSYKDSVVANRFSNTKEFREERGALSGSRFSQGKSNDMEVDFRDLMVEAQKIDPKIKFETGAEGMYVDDQALKSQLSVALNNLITKEMSRIEGLKSSGAMKDNAYKNKMSRLQGAKDRLANPNAIDSLRLNNSGIKDTLTEKKYTKTHESLHDYIGDEDLTEDFSKQIVDNRAGSLTGDIGKTASEMQQGGQDISFDSVLDKLKESIKNKIMETSDEVEKTNLQKKISKIDNISSGSTADRVINYEQDDEDGDTPEDEKTKKPNKEIIASIPELKDFAKKLDDILSKTTPGGSSEVVDQPTQQRGQQVLVHLLRSLSRGINQQIGSSSKMSKAISKLVSELGDTSSPLEVEVVAKQVKKSME